MDNQNPASFVRLIDVAKKYGDTPYDWLAKGLEEQIIICVRLHNADVVVNERKETKEGFYKNSFYEFTEKTETGIRERAGCYISVCSKGHFKNKYSAVTFNPLTNEGKANGLFEVPKDLIDRLLTESPINEPVRIRPYRDEYFYCTLSAEYFAGNPLSKIVIPIPELATTELEKQDDFGNVAGIEQPEPLLGYWGQKRSAELLIKSLCKGLRLDAKEYLEPTSKSEILSNIRTLAEKQGATVKPDTNRMSYGRSLYVLDGIQDTTAKELIRESFGLVKK